MSQDVRQYIGLAVFWIIAGYSFINSYYAFRFPHKYIKANWTMMRGLSWDDPNSALRAGLISLGAGLFFGLGGCYILSDIISKW
jgi:hypothetical protein